MKYLLIALLFLMVSCEKDNNQPAIPEENIQMAADFDSALKSGNWQIVDYYSETAIDYDTNGVSETDLKPHVSLFLWDDQYSFAASQTVVIQGALKIPTIPDETITRSYYANADMAGVEFRFLSHEYLPLVYRLVSFSSTEILVSADYHGTTVFTKYKKVS